MQLMGSRVKKWMYLNKIMTINFKNYVYLWGKKKNMFWLKCILRNDLIAYYQLTIIILLLGCLIPSKFLSAEPHNLDT